MHGSCRCVFFFGISFSSYSCFFLLVLLLTISAITDGCVLSFSRPLGRRSLILVYVDCRVRFWRGGVHVFLRACVCVYVCFCVCVFFSFTLLEFRLGRSFIRSRTGARVCGESAQRIYYYFTGHRILLVCLCVREISRHIIMYVVCDDATRVLIEKSVDGGGGGVHAVVRGGKASFVC